MSDAFDRLALDRWKARAEAAEANLDVARTRWQTLVNTVAGAWNNGLVPGNDDECVAWAIEQIKSRAALQDFTDGGGE